MGKLKNARMRGYGRSGRVVERTGFENRRAARYRGFESHLLRPKYLLSEDSGALLGTLVCYSYKSIQYCDGVVK